MLFTFRRVAPVANTLYNIGGPPAGSTWLIKSLAFYNGAAANTTLYVYLLRGGNSYAIAQAIVGPGGVSMNNSTYVAEAGDVLQFQSVTGFAQRIELCAFGALLG